MYDERYAGYFLRGRDGCILDDPSAAVNVSIATQCAKVDPNQSHYAQRDQYFFDWRNQSAVEWWLDEVIGGVARSSWVDGFFCVCSSIATSCHSHVRVFSYHCCLQGTTHQRLVV